MAAIFLVDREYCGFKIPVGFTLSVPGPHISDAPTIVGLLFGPRMDDWYPAFSGPVTDREGAAFPCLRRFRQRLIAIVLRSNFDGVAFGDQSFNFVHGEGWCAAAGTGTAAK